MKNWILRGLFATALALPYLPQGHGHNILFGQGQSSSALAKANAAKAQTKTSLIVKDDLIGFWNQVQVDSSSSYFIYLNTYEIYFSAVGTIEARMQMHTIHKDSHAEKTDTLQCLGTWDVASTYLLIDYNQCGSIDSSTVFNENQSVDTTLISNWERKTIAGKTRILMVYESDSLNFITSGLDTAYLNYLGSTPNFTIPAIFTAGLFDKRPHRATPYQPSTAYLSNRYVNLNYRLFDLQGRAILAGKVESR
jgi:hypothetical protein